MDVSTFPDLDDSGRSIGEDESILQCLRRGFTTTPTELSYAPDEGFDLRTMLSRAARLSDASEIEARMEEQATRDERIDGAFAEVVTIAPFVARLQVTKTDGSILRLSVASDGLSVNLLRDV